MGDQRRAFEGRTAEATEPVQAMVRAHLPMKDKVDLLDAGCGGRKNLELDQPRHVTCVDISAESLSRYKEADEKVIADIQDYPLGTEQYDLVVCWNVLEHLPRPENALDNLIKTTRRHGLLVLALPNVLSIKGLSTKLTPHIFHVLVLRYIFGHEKAGRQGYAPYRTYLRFSLAPHTLFRFLESRGMTLVYWNVYEGGQAHAVRRKLPVLYALYRLAGHVGHVLSLGRIAAAETDLHVIAKKA